MSASKLSVVRPFQHPLGRLPPLLSSTLVSTASLLRSFLSAVRFFRLGLAAACLSSAHRRPSMPSAKHALCVRCTANAGCWCTLIPASAMWSAIVCAANMVLVHKAEAVIQDIVAHNKLWCALGPKQGQPWLWPHTMHAQSSRGTGTTAGMRTVWPRHKRNSRDVDGAAKAQAQRWRRGTGQMQGAVARALHNKCAQSGRVWAQQLGCGRGGQGAGTTVETWCGMDAGNRQHADGAVEAQAQWWGCSTGGPGWSPAQQACAI
jgi:hypothetical protein